MTQYVIERLNAKDLALYSNELNELIRVVKPSRAKDLDLLQIKESIATNNLELIGLFEGEGDGKRKLVGHVYLYESPVGDDMSLRVENVGILPSHRGKGLAKLLMDDVIASAQFEADNRREPVPVTLTSNPSNDARKAAIALYKSYGFRERAFANLDSKRGTNLFELIVEPTKKPVE